MIFLTVAIITDSRLMILQKIEDLTIQYDNALDNAVWDALDGIVEMADGEKISINKEELLARFFLGLSINLGLTEGDSARQMLEYYFPVMAVMMEDGMYAWEPAADGEGKEFSEKIPYCLERENYNIYFTLSDVIIYEDLHTGGQERGLYQDIRKKYPVEELKETVFDECRRRTIIDMITKQLNEMLEKHSRFAVNGGISYHFSLPVIDLEEWYKTVDDVSFLCVFQGYPYISPQMGTYHKMVLSGARIYKAQNWDLRNDVPEGKTILTGEEEYYMDMPDPKEKEQYFEELNPKTIIE